MARSKRVWWERRPTAPLSDGTTPEIDVYACPASVQVFVADNPQQAQELCDALNQAALDVLGV